MGQAAVRAISKLLKYKQPFKASAALVNLSGAFKYRVTPSGEKENSYTDVRWYVGG